MRKMLWDIGYIQGPLLNFAFSCQLNMPEERPTLEELEKDLLDRYESLQRIKLFNVMKDIVTESEFQELQARAIEDSRLSLDKFLLPFFKNKHPKLLLLWESLKQNFKEKKLKPILASMLETLFKESWTTLKQMKITFSLAEYKKLFTFLENNNLRLIIKLLSQVGVTQTKEKEKNVLNLYQEQMVHALLKGPKHFNDKCSVIREEACQGLGTQFTPRLDALEKKALQALQVRGSMAKLQLFSPPALKSAPYSAQQSRQLINF